MMQIKVELKSNVREFRGRTNFETWQPLVILDSLLFEESYISDQQIS